MESVVLLIMARAESAPVEQAAVAAAAEGIGHKLSALRGRREIGVSELARRIGVSPSLVSQIERGQSRPSVSTLFAMAEALSVPVDAFFRGTEGGPAAGDEPHATGGPSPVGADAAGVQPTSGFDAAGEDGDRAAEPDRYLVRRGERASLDIEGGVRWERLTPRTLADVEFLELVYAPGAESNPTLYRHPGREMLLVLAGELQIHIGFERYDVAAGDSLIFPSTMPHRYVNAGSVEARAVAVMIHDAPAPPET